MSLKKRGIIIILSSPSGAGKTTLVKLLSSRKKFFISVSHTTRKPRYNEKHGKDYFFVNKMMFKKMVLKKEFLEHAKVFKNFYGTTKKNVFYNLDKGKNVIFDIDWQGAQKIISKKLKYKIISFFILPPSRSILRKRLSNRDMKDKLIVGERMKQFDKDILHWKKYDFVVINDNLLKCYKKIVYLINTKLNNRKSNYDINKINKFVKNLF